MVRKIKGKMEGRGVALDVNICILDNWKTKRRRISNEKKEELGWRGRGRGRKQREV